MTARFSRNRQNTRVIEVVNQRQAGNSPPDTGRSVHIERGVVSSDGDEFRCGCGPIPLRFQGGVPAQRAGWLVKGRVASLHARAAHLILFEITNHAVCAAKDQDLLVEAQPPLLEKEGNGAVSDPILFPSFSRRGGCAIKQVPRRILSGTTGVVSYSALPSRQCLPTNPSLREEPANGVFAMECTQSGCRRFDLVFDLTARTAGPLELEVERDACVFVWHENRTQMATQAFAPCDVMQWLFSGSRDGCRNQFRQRLPGPLLENGNRRSASGQDVRRPAAADGNHLRLLMLRCRSATAPLLLQGDGESPGFLPQLQDVSVAEQDAVVGVKDEHESSLVL